MQAPAPDIDLIPLDELLDVTVVLITCSYKGAQFFVVGYYVHVEFAIEQPKESEKEESKPTKKPDPHELIRSVLAEKPMIRRFVINW